MKTTHHERGDGLALTLTGAHVYDVTIRVEDGRTANARVAADDEWKARTRAMAVTDSLRLRGERVDYDVVEVSSWRASVEGGIADHRAHGKTPSHEPQTEAEWVELEERFPNALFATWYVLTGRERKSA